MGAYNNDVLFIHIPKTGGWSVKTYMRDHLPDVLMPDNPEAKLPIGHVRLQDIERFTGRAPESFKLILAVVRDPYEQQLSQWSFWRDRYAKGGRHIHDLVAAQCPDLTTFLLHPQCDFHVWYLQHHGFQPGMSPQEQQMVRDVTIPNPDGQNRYQEFGGMYRFWLTVNDEIPGNVHVLRAETLNEELPRLLKEQFPDRQFPDVPRLNTSPHGKDTREYYTPLAAKLVEEKCVWAFDNYYERWRYSDFA